ncbi:hypothetical protein Pam3_64 [Pseudanabaena phage Pam3]|nr:hypothetical protein Pam3_64 [Pseudanabaena phage Pam3]
MSVFDMIRNGSRLSGALLSRETGATTSTVDPKAQERAEKERLKRLFRPAFYRPNTLWPRNLAWNRVAWVFPQTREAARRRRQKEAVLARSGTFDERWLGRA